MFFKKISKTTLILLIVLAVITAGYILFKLTVKKAEINVVSGTTLKIRCNKGLKSLVLSDSTSKTIVAQYTCYDNSNGTLSNINPTISRSQIKSMVNNLCQQLSKELCERPVYTPSLAPTCQTKGGNCSIGNIGCCAGLTCSNGVCNPPQCHVYGGGGCSTSADCCSELVCASTAGTNSSFNGICITTCQARGSNCSSEKRCCQGLSCLNGSCDTLNCKANGVGGCLTDTDCCTGLICDLPTSAMYGTCKTNPTPKQCSGKGASCLSNSDCCSGLICGITSPYGSSTETLKTTCVAAPTPTVAPIQCKANGVSGCSMDSDCCPGLICTFTSAFTGGTCTTKPTGPTPTTKKWQCSGEGLGCMSDYDCCAGLTCRLTSTELYGSCGKAQ